ncbi:MAG: HAD family hydrolase [Verrucomicrobiota bacterium]
MSKTSTQDSVERSRQTIFFDLDGTLIDHFTTIHRSVAYAQKQLGLAESSYEKVRATVGGSTPVTLERLLGKAHVPEALIHFKEHFSSIMFDDVFALPGASWILENLKIRGYGLAVFTNKIQTHSNETLAHLELDHLLDCIIGTGEIPYRKPQPEFTHYALGEMNTTVENSILIGDSPFDYQTASTVNMKCYLLATGTHDRERLKVETGSDAIYDDLFQLGAEVFGLELPKTVVN